MTTIFDAAWCDECDSEVATVEELGGKALAPHQRFRESGALERCPGSGEPITTGDTDGEEEVRRDGNPGHV